MNYQEFLLFYTETNKLGSHFIKRLAFDSKTSIAPLPHFLMISFTPFSYIGGRDFKL